MQVDLLLRPSAPKRALEGAQAQLRATFPEGAASQPVHLLDLCGVRASAKKQRPRLSDGHVSPTSAAMSGCKSAAHIWGLPRWVAGSTHVELRLLCVSVR